VEGYRSNYGMENAQTHAYLGEAAYALNTVPEKEKLDPQSVRCIFMGYDESFKGYRV